MNKPVLLQLPNLSLKVNIIFTVKIKKKIYIFYIYTYMGAVQLYTVQMNTVQMDTKFSTQNIRHC